MNGRFLNGIKTKSIVRWFKTFKLDNKNFRCQYPLNGVLFLDLKRAFDTVNHNILLEKLKLYGIKGVELKLFQSYLQPNADMYCSGGKLSI